MSQKFCLLSLYNYFAKHFDEFIYVWLDAKYKKYHKFYLKLESINGNNISYV